MRRAKLNRRCVIALTSGCLDAGRANYLLEAAIEKADEQRRKKEKEIARKSATKRLRLADCSSSDSEITELFLVEDSGRVSKTGP